VLHRSHCSFRSDLRCRWVQLASAGNESDWSWNFEVCWIAGLPIETLMERCPLTRRPKVCHQATHGACPQDLARRPLSDFADDGSGAQDRTYRSEPVPAPGTRRDGILKAVAGNFHELVAGDVQARAVRANFRHVEFHHLLANLANLISSVLSEGYIGLHRVCDFIHRCSFQLVAQSGDCNLTTARERNQQPVV